MWVQWFAWAGHCARDSRRARSDQNLGFRHTVLPQWLRRNFEAQESRFDSCWAQ